MNKTAMSLLLAMLFCVAGTGALAAESGYPAAASSAGFMLGEIVVREEKLHSNTAGSQQVIDRSDIEALGATNVAEALQSASGGKVDPAPTSISANGKGESLAGLRGFDPRNVVVLIDGIPVYEPYFRVLDLSRIPVGNVERIRIVKGPTSVLYGPNALGGAINIITGKGHGPPGGDLVFKAGSGNTFRGDSRVIGSRGNFDYFTSVGYAKSDGYPISGDFEKTRNENGGLRENSDYYDYSAAGKFGYNRDRNRIALSASHYEHRGGVPYSMEAIEPSTLWRKLWRKTGASLHGEIEPLKNFLSIKANAYYTRFFNTITTFEDTTISSVADNGDGISTYQNDIVGYTLRPSLSLSDYLDLTLSSLYKYDSVDIQSQKHEVHNLYGAETYAEALQLDFDFEIIDLTAGASWNLYRRTRTPVDDLGSDNQSFDLQAGAAIDPVDWFELYSGYARKSSFPDLKTLYGSNGNPELQPEFADNFDLGLIFTLPWPLTVKTIFFYSRVLDLIGKKDTGNEFYYENIDSARIYGAENSLDLALFEGLMQFKANYTYMKTRDERAGRVLEQLDFRPEHSLFFDFRFNLPHGTEIDAQYSYVSQRKYEQAAAANPVATLPGYGLVMTRIAKTIDLDSHRTNLVLYLETKNLFDVYYELSPQKAAPGRIIMAGLSYRF
jgi:iron complex outermembrane recepter protein